MTPKKRAKIRKQERKMLEGWIQELPLEEAAAWLEAHEQDLAAKLSEVEQEKAGYAALLWLAKLCGTDPLEAVEIVRNKANRTIEEAEALDAWDRIKNKPISK